MARRNKAPTDRRQPHGAVERPAIFHFFKIILSTTLEEKKLRIPHRFVRRFKDELTDVADLIVPSGRVWKVGLSKQGNSIWFDDGWQIFAEHHSICHGYFVVLGYRGFCCFDVIIFDASASEIEFPSAIEAPRYDKSGDEAEMRDDSPCIPVKRHSCLIANKIGWQKREETRREKQGKRRISEFREPVAIDTAGEAESSDKFEDKVVKIISCGNLERIVTNSESARALSAARMCKPKYPSFLIMLRASSFEYRQYVPGGFSRYLTNAPRTLKLRVSEGKEWEVCLTKRPDRWDLGKGWFIFLKDNNLKGGDVCVFEMQKNKSVLKVSLFRAFKDGSHENEIQSLYMRRKFCLTKFLTVTLC